MGKLNPNKIYVNLGEVVLKFSYKDFIYFIYNLGMDYYDGLDIISDEDWHDILEALKENYVQYEVEKKIKYKEFRENMASFLNTKFYKHKHAYEVMTDVMTSFGQGNDTAKLNHLINDFEEREKFKQECTARIQNY